MDVRLGSEDIGEMLAVVGVKGWRCCVCNMTFPRFFSIDHHMNTDHAVPNHVGAPSLGRIVPSSDQPQDETSVSSTNQAGAQYLESIISSPCHTQQETNLASANLAQAPSVCFSDKNSLAVEHISTCVPIQTDASVSHKGSGVFEKPAADICIKKEPLESIDSTGQQQQTQHDSFQIVGMRGECHESLPSSDSVPSVASNKESSDLHKTTLSLILSTHGLLSENLSKKVYHGNKIPDFKEQNTTSSSGYQRHQSEATTAPVGDIEGIEARFDSMCVTRTDSPSSDVSGKQLPSRSQSPSHDIWNARIHHSLRFRCSCGELIRSKHEFKKHRKTCFAKHKTFPCPVCGVVFGQKKGLKQHMHIKGWQTVLCKLCTKQFHDHYALQRHFESAHPHSETSLHAVNTQENVEIHGDQKQASGKEKEDGDVQGSNKKDVDSTQPIVVELPSVQPLCPDITSSRPPLETQMSIITSEEQHSSDTELSIVVEEMTSPARLSGEITGGDNVIEISDEETDNEEIMNSPRTCEKDEEGGEHSEESSRFAHKWQDRKWRRMCKIMSLHPPCSAGFGPFWAHWGPRGRWGRGMSFWGQHRPPFGPPPPSVSSLPSPPPPPPPPPFNFHFPMPPFGRFHGPYHHGDPYNSHHHHPHHHKPHHHFYGRHTDMHKSNHGSCHGCLQHLECEWYREPNTPQSTEGEGVSQGKHDAGIFSGEENRPSFCADVCTDDVRDTTSGDGNHGSSNRGPRTSAAEQKTANARQSVSGEEPEFQGIDCLFKGGRKKQIFAFLVWRLKEGDKRWYCPDCRQGFDNNEELKVHCAYHHKYKRFPCFVCEEKLECPAAFANHVRHHFFDFQKLGGHPLGKFRERGRGFMGWGMKHRGGHAAFPRHVFFPDCDGGNGSSDDGTGGREGRECPVCKVKLPVDMREEEFETHVCAHQDGEGGEASSLKCEICGKEYMARASLLRHMHTHSGTLPLKCNICGERFLESRELTRHQTTHTGQVAYTCTECGAGFTLRSSLLTHTRSRHTGEKPFPCPSCPKRFASSSLLSRHRARCKGSLLNHGSPASDGTETGTQGSDTRSSIDPEANELF